jgi:hypothetical protein
MSGNPESTIRNPKSEGSAECAGASGPGNQMIADFGMRLRIQEEEQCKEFGSALTLA